jgi:hypothetical protein
MRSVFWILLAQTMKFRKIKEFLNREISGTSRRAHLRIYVSSYEYVTYQLCIYVTVN